MSERHDGEPGTSAVDLVDTAVAAGQLPGIVLAVGTEGSDDVLLHSAGRTSVLDDGRPVTVDTVFDLASLTKVVATTPCVLRLVERGDVGLDDAVRGYLPGFTGAGKDQVTVRQLLAHTSGLPADRRYHEQGLRGAELFAAALAEPLVAAPGSTVLYSDLGFVALGQLVTAVTGEPLDAATRRLVLDPLGMRRTRFRPPAAWQADMAATETRPDGTAIIGVVHDEKAEAAGGVAGHAGLFGTAADLGRYLVDWLSAESLLLSAATRAEALRCQTRTLEGRRGLGWTLRGDRYDHMGELWSARGAGHTGFTGTSVAVDPDAGRWVVLLTNGVHLGRDATHVKALRRAVHDAVARDWPARG
jgi:CubicO group peptidase (beta-lactamase class C family)